MKCSKGREGGTYSTCAQCSGEQITRGNTKRCDLGDRGIPFRDSSSKRKRLLLVYGLAAIMQIIAINYSGDWARVHQKNESFRRWWTKY